MLVLAAVTVVVAAAWAVLVLAAALSARHRAAAVADLAALAAADTGAALGAGPDCGRAGEVARANRAVLIGCVVSGRVVEVRVRAPLPPVAGMLEAPVRRARAGPAEPR